MVWNGNPMAFLVGNNPTNTAAALFIWATEDGTIAAWQAGLSPETEAVIVVSNTNLTAGPVYKGLAIGNNSRGLSFTLPISGPARSRCGTARLVPTPRST